MRRLNYIRNYALFMIALTAINFTGSLVALACYCDFIGLCFTALTSITAVEVYESIDFYIATYKYLKTSRARKHRQVMLESKNFRKKAHILESEALWHTNY